MRMKWSSLLFAHWRIEAKLLRPLIPPRLSIDTFDGSAWIGVVPFTMSGVRASWLPPVPGTTSFHELNVRTYVHMSEGGGRPSVPGVWFFSLDAASKLAVRVARKAYHLPYFNARMTLRPTAEMVTYTSERTHAGAPPAQLSAVWSIGEPIPRSEPPAPGAPRSEGSLEWFLTERYCLYAAQRSRPGHVLRAMIHHDPWSLRRARLAKWNSSMIEALGLPEPDGEPVLHAADPISVEAWKPRKVGP